MNHVLNELYDFAEDSSNESGWHLLDWAEAGEIVTHINDLVKDINVLERENNELRSRLALHERKDNELAHPHPATGPHHNRRS